MPLPKIIPALADLTEDIAGPVPLELLYAWAAGDQHVDRADALLAPYRVDGIVVSSDTTGLSRLTKERDLIDVLALISEPKQVLHAFAVEIGGRPIGTWVADNTQVYYPATVDAPTVVAAMAEAGRRISCELSLGVGMCVHHGSFYELGGGLYGLEAHLVESLAEHYAGAGEILATAPVRTRCGDGYGFRERGDLRAFAPEGVFVIEDTPTRRALDPQQRTYPHPYPADFFESLIRFRRSPDQEALRRQIYDRYLQCAVVVFIAREREADASWNGAGLLDDLVANVLLDAVVIGLEGARGHIAGLGGGLAILTFDNAADAYEAADVLRRRIAVNGLRVKIGIASGPVLMFPNPRGPSGIAGSAVNIASKISEDAGFAGRINIAAHVAADLPQLQGQPFEITVGSVVLYGTTV